MWQSPIPQKLARTSPTSGGCSVGIVRSQTQATEFVFFLFVVDRWKPTDLEVHVASELLPDANFVLVSLSSHSSNLKMEASCSFGTFG
jgi:hypothetical protein